MYYKYDVKNGIIYDWTKFFIPIIITIIACICFNSEINAAENYGYIDRNVNFTDVLIYIFKGEKPFNPESNENFKFPFMWLIIQLSIAFITGKYPFYEIYDNHGALVLMKGGSRKKWMMSKFLWLISVCLIYYALILMTTAIYSCMSGYSLDFSLPPSNSYVLLTSDETIYGVKLLKILILPLLTSIAFSALQTAIALVLQPVYGFAFVLGFCGISVFTNSVYIFGNCSLLIRNEYFCFSDINTNKSILILLIVILVSLVFSLVYFEKCDILHNRRNE